MAYNRLAGVTSVTINGASFNLVSDPAWDAGRTEKTPLVGLNGIHGYKEVVKPVSISMTLRDGPDYTVQDLIGLTTATVQFIQANGKMVIGTDMFFSGTTEVNAEEGTFTVRFEGGRIDEVTV